MPFTFLVRYFRSRKAYSDAFRELTRYSDYELRDVRVNRADIPRLAREAAAEARRGPRPKPQDVAPHDLVDVWQSWRLWRHAAPRRH